MQNNDTQLKAYIIDMRKTEPFQIGQYTIYPVSNMEELQALTTSTVPNILYLTQFMNQSIAKSFAVWFNHIDKTTLHIYVLDSENEKEKLNFNHQNLYGQAFLDEESLNAIHPLYSSVSTKDEIEVIDRTEVYEEVGEGRKLTEDRIIQAQKNISATFYYVTSQQAQDVFLLEGENPAIRVSGELLKERSLKPWTIDEFNVFISMLLGVKFDKEGVSETKYLEELKKSNGTLDLHADLGDTNLRCHLYRAFPKNHGENDIRNFNAVINIRVVPKEMPVLENLNLPEISEIFQRESGLVLISGRSNDGKSTTVASIVNQFNYMTDKNRIILTIEEPVEFVHVNQNAWIIQRRVGEGGDSISYAQATEDAMREDTDIVVIQELRKADEMHNALRLAEIGKLVISTIHANSVGGTVDRFVNEFPSNEQEQVRIRLLDNIVAIIHQNLLTYDGKQYPLVSMVIVSDAQTKSELRSYKNGIEIDEYVAKEGSHTRTNLLSRELNATTLHIEKGIPVEYLNKYVDI